MLLQTYLKANGLTDQAFATLVGCDRSLITKLRHGDCHASFKRLKRIEEASGGRVTAADIYEARKQRLALAEASRAIRRKGKLMAAE